MILPYKDYLNYVQYLLNSNSSNYLRAIDLGMVVEREINMNGEPYRALTEAEYIAKTNAVERRKIRQEWYETETTKTSWDSHGWIFDDGTSVGSDWDVTIYEYDKFGNPISGIAERK